jgi:hypothetical protein
MLLKHGRGRRRTYIAVVVIWLLMNAKSVEKEECAMSRGYLYVATKANTTTLFMRMSSSAFELMIVVREHVAARPRFEEKQRREQT